MNARLQRTARALIAFAVGAFLVPGAHAAPAPDAWALVVGVNGYQHVRPLEYAVSDARSYRQFLIEWLAVPADQIVYLADDPAVKTDGAATRENILLALDRIYGREGILRAEDEFFFYFSGHGISQQSSRGVDGYLLPIETPGDEERLFTAAVPMRDLRKYAIENLASRQMLFVVDSCFSGLAGGLPNDALFSAVRDNNPVDSDATYLLTAGRRDEPVVEISSLGGGLFTHSLIAGVTSGKADLDGDRSVTTRELNEHVRAESLRQYAELRLSGQPQEPQRFVLRGGESDLALRSVAAGSRVRRAEAVALLSDRKKLLAPAPSPSPAESTLKPGPEPVSLVSRKRTVVSLSFPPAKSLGGRFAELQDTINSESGRLARRALLEQGFELSAAPISASTEAESLRQAKAGGATLHFVFTLDGPVTPQSVTGLSWSSEVTVTGRLYNVESGTLVAEGLGKGKAVRMPGAPEAAQTALYQAIHAVTQELIPTAMERAQKAGTTVKTFHTLEIDRLAPLMAPVQFGALVEKRSSGRLKVVSTEISDVTTILSLESELSVDDLRKNIVLWAGESGIDLKPVEVEPEAARSVWAAKRK